MSQSASNVERPAHRVAGVAINNYITRRARESLIPRTDAPIPETQREPTEEESTSRRRRRARSERRRAGGEFPARAIENPTKVRRRVVQTLAHDRRDELAARARDAGPSILRLELLPSIPRLVLKQNRHRKQHSRQERRREDVVGG